MANRHLSKIEKRKDYDSWDDLQTIENSFAQTLSITSHSSTSMNKELKINVSPPWGYFPGKNIFSWKHVFCEISYVKTRIQCVLKVYILFNIIIDK